MLPPFEIRAHTADIRLYVSGRTKEDLFRNALRGMANIIKAESASAPQRAWLIKRRISVDAPDAEALLVGFLNEALYFSDAANEVFRDASFLSFSDTHLDAEILGERVEEFDEDIKAVTHHELKISRRPDGYLEATLIFDI